MLEFYTKTQKGNLLPRHRQFQPWLQEHHRESQGLYYFFYFAWNWETLEQNLCWARLHINSQMFVQVMLQTFARRQDYENIVLPKIHEIQPKRFLNNRQSWIIRKFNYDLWNQTTSQNLTTQFRQLKRNQLESLEMEVLRNSPSLMEMWDSCKVMLYEDVETTKYFEADIGLKTHWYYLNLAVNVFDLNEHLSSSDLRDYWFWSLQRLLGRFNLELDTVEKKEKETPDFLA